MISTGVAARRLAFLSYQARPRQRVRRAPGFRVFKETFDELVRFLRLRA